jgi:hypothetical protein
MSSATGVLSLLPLNIGSAPSWVSNMSKIVTHIRLCTRVLSKPPMKLVCGRPHPESLSRYERGKGVPELLKTCLEYLTAIKTLSDFWIIARSSDKVEPRPLLEFG